MLDPRYVILDSHLNFDLPFQFSQATPIIGQTENGQKTTQKTLKVLPEVIIYDVSLTLTLPPKMTVTSGLNAIAHAVEALYAQEANPIINLLAQEGIKSIAKALPIVIRGKGDVLQARSDALYGAWACGTCLGAVGMSLHHKLCHTLGSSLVGCLSIITDSPTMQAEPLTFPMQRPTPSSSLM